MGVVTGTAARYTRRRFTGTAAGGGGPLIYSTSFSGSDENPISQGGKWTVGQTHGVDWSNMAIGNHIAHGKHRNIQFSDPTALLTGVGTFSANQQAEIKITGVGTQGGCVQEQEVRLRSRFTNGSPNLCTGYEIFMSTTGGAGADYFQVVRWEGALGSFTQLYNLGSGLTAANNQTIRAKMVGDRITFWVIDTNGSTVLFTDFVDDTSTGGHAKFADGYPGMGMYIGSSCLGSLGNEHLFGAIYFEAREV